MKSIRLVVLVLLGLLAAVVVREAVQAAPSAVSFTVNSTLDDVDSAPGDGYCRALNAINTCTLRAATMEANTTSGPGVTIVLPSGTYTLTRGRTPTDGDDNGDLNLTAPLTDNTFISIEGAGAGSTIVTANQIDRVLSIAAGRTAMLSGVTLRDGYRLGVQGGGVFNSGTLQITSSVIEHNQTDAAGGGIYSPGTLTISRSTIRSNLAFLGGAFWTHGHTKVHDSTLYGNSAVYGGAIEVYAGAPSQLIIVNSTISQNNADTNGGGIDSEGDTFLYNTTIVDNDADHDHDQSGGTGGGVYANPGSRFVVVNSLIARNTFAVYSDNDCSGTLEGYGWNLLSDLSGCTFSGNGISSRATIDPNSLGPLQNNGGPTLTHALLRGSAAIDATYNTGCTDDLAALVTSDQRGAPRGAGLACDVGAFEYQPPLYLPLIRR